MMTEQENNNVLQRELQAICQELQEKMNIIHSTARDIQTPGKGTADSTDS